MGLGWLISKKLASRIGKLLGKKYSPMIYCNFWFGRRHQMKYISRSDTQADGSWGTYYKCQNFHCKHSRTLISYDNSLANPETHPHLAFAQDPEDVDEESDLDVQDAKYFRDRKADEDDNYNTCTHTECSRFEGEEVPDDIKCHICLGDETDCEFCRGMR